ncbi:MAG TPA: endonuclease/exonuclease/phosphatase family protein [Polyangiaceae bacterium]
MTLRPRPVARVMTYNVHSFVGTDRVYDPERVARVIESAGASIVALQEVDFGRGSQAEPSAIESLAERLKMRCHFTFTRDGRRGHFGNAVLTPYSLQLIAEGFLPRRRDEARAVQWLKVVAENFELQLMNTHLSVSFRERSAQVRALLGAEWMVQAGTDVPLVVCGDFNSSPLSAVYRKLSRDLRDVQWGAAPRRATWPSRLPFWRIDHMFVSRSVGVRSCGVIAAGLARVASDHLPLVAELDLP